MQNLNKDKLSEIETELDGIQFSLEESVFQSQMALGRLKELRETLQDKQEDKF